MSIISGKIDKLRTAARTYRKLGNYTVEGMFLEAADTINTAEGLLLKADDTIMELRTENDKLRKLCADLRFCKRHNCLTCSHGRFCDMHFDERYAELKIRIG